MKKTFITIIGIVAVLLAITACQPKYVIFPIPDNTPVVDNAIDVNSLSSLIETLSSAPAGSHIRMNLSINPTEDKDKLPVELNSSLTLSGNVKVSGADQSGATGFSLSSMLTANVEDETVNTADIVIFKVADTASVNINELTVSVEEDVASSVSSIVEVDAGTLAVNQLTVKTVSSTGTTVETPDTLKGITLGDNASSDKISISGTTANIEVSENNTDSKLEEEINNSNPEAVVTKPYYADSESSYNEALENYQQVKLTEDIKLSSFTFPESEEHDTYVIDLNNFTLTVNADEQIKLPASKTITIQNGKFVTNIENLSKDEQGAWVSKANIIFGTNDVVTFDHVTYEGNAGGLALGTDEDSATGSTLSVKNSSFSTQGAFCVATNANKKDDVQVTDDVSITLEKSSFTSTNDYFDNCPVFFNITTDLTVTNCKITGDRQALFARGGTVKISDTDLITTGKFNPTRTYFDTNWGGGNEAPYAALVVGNRSNTGVYDYDVTVSIDAESSIEIQDNSNGAFDVYVSSCNRERTTTFISPTFAESVINSENNPLHYYEGEGSTLIIRKSEAGENLVPQTE